MRSIFAYVKDTDGRRQAINLEHIVRAAKNGPGEPYWTFSFTNGDKVLLSDVQAQEVLDRLPGIAVIVAG